MIAVEASISDQLPVESAGIYSGSRSKTTSEVVEKTDRSKLRATCGNSVSGIQKRYNSRGSVDQPISLLNRLVRSVCLVTSLGLRS